MGHPLSAADRSSLFAEQGPVNMTMGGVVILERGPGLTYDAICNRIAERIHLLPRYTQRLQEPQIGIRQTRSPRDMLYHTWVPDEHFDVHQHVRLATLPAPGGEAQLAAYVGREFSRRMDRTRSPWELHIIDGYRADQGDFVAVVMKMHHALVDGVAAVGIGMILLDTDQDPPPIDPPSETPVPEQVALHRYMTRLATSSATKGARLMWAAADRLLDISPRSAEADMRRVTNVLVKVVRARAAAPRLPFNRTISANRSYAFGSFPLAPVKAASKKAGGTVNDGILAAVTEMVALYLRDCGVDPARLPRDPVALVPVSIRRPGEEGGNRISIVFIDLPIGEPDPIKRIKLIADRTSKIRGSADVIAGAFMVDSLGFVPPLMASVLAGVPSMPIPGGGGKIANNIVVSNVPGPRMPLYFNGAKVLALHPVVPLNPSNQGLNVGVFSYNGTICWGINADRALNPTVVTAADALRESLAELGALAH